MQALAPFTVAYTAQIPELMLQLNCSLAISTFQAGKLIFLSPKDEHSLIQLPRNFAKPMGFSFNDDFTKMALACKDEVIVLTASKELAQHYPNKPATYDALYMPRLTYHTGALDIHDLHFGAENKLYAVNTLFSCIVTFDEVYNFTPFWMPPQITELAGEDRCHLNGMAMKDGKPKYASAFNQGNTHQSWRDNLLSAGVIYDIESSELVCEGLAMPHSPKIYNGQLYVLQSAKGELTQVDINSGRTETVTFIGGFLRGMTLIGEYLFVARSKLRKNSSTFKSLDIDEKHNTCTITAVHLPTGSIAGHIHYKTSVDEIYDIHALPHVLRPNILNTISEDYKLGLTAPGATYWAKKQPENE
jgi:uncharacterized protein (TIGR03032 family)